MIKGNFDVKKIEEDSIVLFTSRLKPFVYDTNDVYPERVQNKKYT